MFFAENHEARLCSPVTIKVDDFLVRIKFGKVLSKWLHFRSLLAAYLPTYKNVLLCSTHYPYSLGPPPIDLRPSPVHGFQRPPLPVLRHPTNAEQCGQQFWRPSLPFFGVYRQRILSKLWSTCIYLRRLECPRF